MKATLEQIKRRGSVLMLDFDGTLSPLTRDPSKARMSSRTRRALSGCAKRMPVAIITGRRLSDIEKRVRLENLLYAGSHGLEWKIDGHVHRRNLPAKGRAAFLSARRSLLRFAREFRGLFIEDKPYCLAINYRSLTAFQEKKFREGARSTVAAEVSRRAVRIIDHLFTFEIIAEPEWTKGECAKHLYAITARKNEVPVYIGDSLTDEDAFRALRRGITIRVGQSRSSAARYYFKRREEVDAFLDALAAQK